MTIPDEQEDQDVQIGQVNYRPSVLLRTLDRLASWFVDDRAYPNPDDKLRAKVFVLEHLFSPFLAFAIAAMLYFGADVTTTSLYLLVPGFSLFFAYPLAIKWGLSYRGVSISSLVQLSLLVFSSIYYFNGMQSFVIPWVAAIPVVGMLFIGVPGAILTCFLATLGLLTMLALHLSGHEFPQTVVAEWRSVAFILSASLCVIFISGIVLCHLSLYRLSQRRLQHELRRHQQTTARFRQARDAADKASLAKSRFLATASHEFRTPLTTIQAGIDLLLRYHDRIDENQRADYLHDVIHQVKTLTRMLDNLLLVGEEDETNIVFQPETMKLADVCQDMVRQMRLGAQKGDGLKISFSGDCKTAYMDEGIVRLILSNLLSNAIKYSPPQAEVSLAVARLGDMVLFRIDDHGEGIAESEVERIFERYYRVSGTQRVGGTGLGLSIVKAAVEAHHGTIRVDSRRGVGSSFIVNLPATSGEN
ncbi:MAG: HAMP domain-containing sensor histidine kinase [Rhodospirillales bacterium]|nr:HAMP domain-containing sensor histidine kinase [Rhodospirillales bacterium]